MNLIITVILSYLKMDQLTINFLLKGKRNDTEIPKKVVIDSLPIVWNWKKDVFCSDCFGCVFMSLMNMFEFFLRIPGLTEYKFTLFSRAIVIPLWLRCRWNYNFSEFCLSHNQQVNLYNKVVKGTRNTMCYCNVYEVTWHSKEQSRGISWTHSIGIRKAN
jgi:hypothetical protein